MSDYVDDDGYIFTGLKEMGKPVPGRDCEHGRQIGKCSDCELQEAYGEISNLEQQVKELQGVLSDCLPIIEEHDMFEYGEVSILQAAIKDLTKTEVKS